MTTETFLQTFNFDSEFAQLAESTATLLNQYDLNVRPYRSSADLAFSKLPQEVKVKYFTHFKAYYEILSETHHSGKDLREAKHLLWNMLNRLKYRVTDDILSRIADHQIVEIYNLENIQVFRNLPFFKICSYSIDEIVSLPWWQLYKREDAISQLIFQYASKVLNGETTETVAPEVPLHLLEERDSFGRHKMNVTVEWMSPLKSALNGNAVLVVEEATLLSN